MRTRTIDAGFSLTGRWRFLNDIFQNLSGGFGDNNIEYGDPNGGGEFAYDGCDFADGGVDVDSADCDCGDILSSLLDAAGDL